MFFHSNQLTKTKTNRNWYTQSFTFKIPIFLCRGELAKKTETERDTERETKAERDRDREKEIERKRQVQEKHKVRN